MANSSTGPKKKKTTKRSGGRRATAKDDATGASPDAPTGRAGRGGPRYRTAESALDKHLVIVESPAKAKTINRYLGPDYVVEASVGHVRDLPSKAPKGQGRKQPVPGVDLEHRFTPTYEVLDDKKQNIRNLKKLAKEAKDVWFATDLDREGEAIAWHLAEVLGIAPKEAKRVVFNAITKDEIARAFQNPHSIDMDKVNAQQARRILDRIVGYQVSPLLWKKVARGLSAGRVQSVAVRIVVERERAIRAFVPEEYWKVGACLALDAASAAALVPQWQALLETRDANGRAPSQRARNEWLGQHDAVRAELVELGGAKFELGAKGVEDLSDRVRTVADAVGLAEVRVDVAEDPDGKGPARFRRQVHGRVAPGVRYRVRSVETARNAVRPNPPFITSSLQMSASNALGMKPQRTMRIAQQLYEGVALKGEGQVGLITYMRTDSTHLSGEAIRTVREHIGGRYGDRYLPEKPNFFGKASENAQEAHEAIRPTDVRRVPDEALETQLAAASRDGRDMFRLYRLIWQRFVACQMTPAQWDGTTVLMERADRDTGAVLKASGRTLAFDGFYRVTGVPTSADEATLPRLEQGADAFPFAIEPEQRFTEPPRRYTEASLVKRLEEEGIGRPSTYASIIGVIQDREYVRTIERALHATDLGEVVTDKLLEAFPEDRHDIPRLMNLGYTREMEAELDKVAEQHHDWVEMLERFYGPFRTALEEAAESMTHARAETEPAPYACPKCQARTAYRFGRNGRFLSCSRYPDCDFASPIDREGRPVQAQQVNVRCPQTGQPMMLRSGRFGRFIASPAYPEVKFVLNLDRKGGIKLPVPPPLVTELPCPKCGKPLNLRTGKRGPWLGCSGFPKCRGRESWSKLDAAQQAALEAALAAHEQANPVVKVVDLDGTPIAEGTLVEALILPDANADLPIHPDAQRDTAA